METPKETAYDEQIAPLMTQIIEIAQTHGIGIKAYFQLDENDEGQAAYCETSIPSSDGDTITMQMVWAAFQAKGNADSLIIWMKRHAQKYGHSSMALHLLGVPVK